MTIREELMGIGDWDLTLAEGCPGHLTDRLNDWASYLVVTGQHVDPDIVASQTRPLYRGTLLTRTGQQSASGHGPAWGLGTADTELNGTNATGPYFANNFADTSIATVHATIASKNGITPGTLTVSGTITANLHNTPRTLLDLAICPQLDCEWRVNTDLTLDIGTATQLGNNGKPIALLKAGQTGREPMSTADSPIGWQIAALDPTLDFAEYRNRAVVKYDNPTVGWADTGAPTDSFKTLGGQQLEIAGFDTSQSNAFAAGARANWLLPRWRTAQRSINVELDDYLVKDQLAAPHRFVGSWLWIYDPNIGLYDRGNKVDWAGTTIYPAKIRVVDITYPLTRGMGVYLDNRHQGGGITDLTEWVEWESDGLGTGGTPTSLTLGQPPRWWTGKRRIHAT